MPPKPKTPEEIFNEREIILSNALVLIIEKGYAGLTMRDLAKLCNFSPTKIYYYFSNKDDIVLNIMQKGYKLLSELTIEALQKETTLRGKCECVSNELFKFGVQYEEYFNIMFAVSVPHTTDFLTDETLEFKAINFKKIAVDYFVLFADTHKNYAKSNGIVLEDIDTMAIFAQILGVLKLYSAKITRELEFDVNELFSVSLRGILKSLEPNL